jgi:hypothetical protein
MKTTVIGRARYSDLVAAYTPIADARSALDKLQTDADYSTEALRHIVTIRRELRRSEAQLRTMIENLEQQNPDLFSSRLNEYGLLETSRD